MAKQLVKRNPKIKLGARTLHKTAIEEFINPLEKQIGDISGGTKMFSRHSYIGNGLYFKPIQDVQWYKDKWNIVIMDYIVTFAAGNTVALYGKLVYVATEQGRFIIDNTKSNDSVKVNPSIAVDGRIEFHNNTGQDIFLMVLAIGRS